MSLKKISIKIHFQTFLFHCYLIFISFTIHRIITIFIIFFISLPLQILYKKKKKKKLILCLLGFKKYIYVSAWAASTCSDKYLRQFQPYLFELLEYIYEQIELTWASAIKLLHYIFIQYPYRNDRGTKYFTKKWILK
jgi:hypothetical protein